MQPPALRCLRVPQMVMEVELLRGAMSTQGTSLAQRVLRSRRHLFVPFFAHPMLQTVLLRLIGGLLVN